MIGNHLLHNQKCASHYKDNKSGPQNYFQNIFKTQTLLSSLKMHSLTLKQKNLNKKCLKFFPTLILILPIQKFLTPPI